MNITVNTKEIQEALKKLQKVAPKRGSHPAIQGFLLNAANDVVSITATDSDVTVKITFQDIYTLIEENGSILLEAETVKLIQKMNSPLLTITENEITAQKRKIKFTGLDTANYPNTNQYTYNDELFTITKESFLNVISVKYACSTSDTRPILKGVCLNNDLIVATDSHRLAKKEITFENNVKSNIVIPKYALDYIEKFQNKKVSGNIEVLATSEKISDSVTDYKCIKFVFENIEMQVRPIQGNYPDVRRIIPENFKTEYKINKSKLVEELKLMAEISETLVIRYTKEGINLFAKTSDKRNTLESNLDVEYITYDNLEYIGFNPQYVLEALERLEGDIMTFRYTGKDTPFMINDEALILPIRLTNINEYVA